MSVVEEEATDRYQLEIEDAVAQYQNEPRIRHNVCPDSDSDVEGDNVPIVHVSRSHRIERRCRGALYLGKPYSSGVAFKENVLDFALNTGYNIKQYRWDQRKLGYCCGMDKCPWRIYCSVNKRKNRWEIKRLIEPHGCNPNGVCEMLTDPIIARLFVDKIREDPEYFKPKRIQGFIRENYKGISVSRNQCQEAKIEGNCCEDVENNSVESFNNSIVTARERPVMPMLELIRRLAMVRINTRSAIANKHQAMFTPYVKEILDEELDDATKSKVYAGSTGQYEVEIGYEYEAVDLIKRECTCCKWQITGIRCVHVYGVILYIKDDPNKYVADWFLTSRWRDTYEHAPNPVRGPDSWICGDISLVSEDPERKRKNTKEKRKRSVNESPSKKKKKKKTSSMEQDDVLESQDNPKRKMHCKMCGGAGHNKRTCSRKKKGNGGECSTQSVSQVDDA